MTSIALFFSQGQHRRVSEAAHFGDLYETFSRRMIAQIRRLCLEILENPNTPSVSQEGAKIHVTFPKDRLVEAFQGVKKDLLQEHFDASLVERVSQVFSTYLHTRKGVSLSVQDLEEKSFLDKKMDEWAEQARMRSLLSMEQARGTKREEIPQELQKICCYRYALMQAEVSTPLAITKKTLHNVLQQECTQVNAPQEGDLIVFCRGNSPVHLGVIREGKVLSKEGNASPVAYLRDVADLTPQYGDRVLYFRRNEAMEVAQ